VRVDFLLELGPLVYVFVGLGQERVGPRVFGPDRVLPLLR